MHASAFSFVILLALRCALGHERIPRCSASEHIDEIVSKIVGSEGDEDVNVMLLQTHVQHRNIAKAKKTEAVSADQAEHKHYPFNVQLPPFGESLPQVPTIAIEVMLFLTVLFYRRIGTWVQQASVKAVSKTAIVKTDAQIEETVETKSDAIPEKSESQEPRLLHHRIISIAASDPDRIALIEGDVQETFGELQACALYVARHLIEDRGVKPCSRTPIGVCAEGRHMMHAILGIVQTGNPYVPLPPNLPSATRDFVVADAHIEIVLADQRSLAEGGAWAGRAEASPEHVLVSLLKDDWKPSWEVNENDLAYILYTSGSTGKPKGVLSPHYSYHNRLEWMWRTYPFNRGEVGIQKTAIEWIDHVQEVFGVLGGGAQLVLAPIEARTNPVKLLGLCREHAVSRLVLVPSLLRVIVGSFGKNLAHEFPCLKFWIVSGEPFPTDLLRAALECAALGSLVLNTYGTTEIAGDVSWAAYGSSSTLPESTVVPVGAAIPPNRIHLLDPDSLQPVLPGAPGEIFIEGPHVTLGYHKRPTEDVLRYVKLPHLGIQKAFRTGDFGKLDENQLIQFLGRQDQQIKVHGQRVEALQVEFELGEALCACVENASVIKPLVLSWQFHPSSILDPIDCLPLLR